MVDLSQRNFQLFSLTRDYIIHYLEAQYISNVSYLMGCRRKCGYHVIISPKDNKVRHMVCQMGRTYAGRASFVCPRRESGVIIG